MPNIVDPQGRPIKLNDRQKNELYRKAKNMKENIRNSLCTKDETQNPTERNVDKMLNSEFKRKPEVESFKEHMKAIGADPKDYNIEKIRR